MKRIPVITDDCIVVFGGREYVIEIAEPACGNWHYHDEDHVDGSPGLPQHHHHDAKCDRRTALLVPLHPEHPEWTPNTVQGKPVLYRIRNQKLTGTQEFVTYEDFEDIPTEPVG